MAQSCLNLKQDLQEIKCPISECPGCGYTGTNPWRHVKEVRCAWQDISKLISSLSTVTSGADSLVTSGVTGDLAPSGVAGDLAPSGVAGDLAPSGVAGDLAHSGDADVLVTLGGAGILMPSDQAQVHGGLGSAEEDAGASGSAFSGIETNSSESIFADIPNYLEGFE